MWFRSNWYDFLYYTNITVFIRLFLLWMKPFSTIKLVSFILIWIAVIIYLKDLYETN